MISDQIENTRLKQALFILNKSGNPKYYKFDINQNISIKNLKKMIIKAANLSKSGLHIFYKGEEYTHFDDNILSDLFPDTQVVEFEVMMSAVPEEKSDTIRLKFKQYCDKHDYKYPYFYCYDCSKSVCYQCQLEDHKLHSLKEKYDYLQSSKNLVENVFSGINNYIEGSNKELKSIQSIQDRIKIEFFPQLAEMLHKLETKLLEVTDFFVENEKLSSSNMEKNTGLMKTYISESLEKLKKEINIEEIMINEEIFLTYDTKFKEVSGEKNRIFNDAQKLSEMRKSEQNISLFVENMYSELYDTINKWLQMGTFTEIKTKIASNSITIVKKEEIEHKILSDVKKRDTNKKSKSSETPGKLHPQFWSGSMDVNRQLNFPSALKDNKQVETPIRNNETPVPPKENAGLTKKYIIVSRCIPDTNSVNIFRNNMVDTISVNFNNFLGVNKFLPECASVNVDGKLYISGGLLSHEEPSDSFMMFDPSNETLIGLPKLNFARHSHSMICHNGFIYFVGGNTQNVEKYEISSQKYIKLNSMLSRQRLNPILYVHKNLLYAFFGKSLNSNDPTLERLNLKNIKGRWEYVSIQSFGVDVSQLMSNSGILPINENQILFIGGKTTKSVSKDIVNFDFSNFSFNPWPNEKLNEEMYFGESLLINLEEGKYGHFNLNKLNSFINLYHE